MPRPMVASTAVSTSARANADRRMATGHDASRSVPPREVIILVPSVPGPRPDDRATAHGDQSLASQSLPPKRLAQPSRSGGATEHEAKLRREAPTPMHERTRRSGSILRRRPGRTTRWFRLTDVPEGTPASCRTAQLVLPWQPIVTAEAPTGRSPWSSYPAGAPARLWVARSEDPHGISHRVAVFEIRQHAAGAVGGVARGRPRRHPAGGPPDPHPDVRRGHDPLRQAGRPRRDLVPVPQGGRAAGGLRTHDHLGPAPGHPGRPRPVLAGLGDPGG